MSGFCWIQPAPGGSPAGRSAPRAGAGRRLKIVQRPAAVPRSCREATLPLTPGKKELLKGCQEREVGRSGQFRSPSGQMPTQSETDRPLPAKKSCNSTDEPELVQRAGQPGVGYVTRRDGGRDGRVRHVACRRKLDPDALRERWQRRCRRRQARAAQGVEPTGALAQLAGQRVPRVLAGAHGAGEAAKRTLIERRRPTCMPAAYMNRITYTSLEH